MNDFALSENPRLRDLVDSYRMTGFIIKIEQLGPMKGPGFATSHDEVILNNWFLRGQDPEFTEDRLIIVLLHELGHIKYQANIPTASRDIADSEYAAFENSLQEAIVLTKSGDIGPIGVALHYLEQRQKSGEEPEHYQDALDRIIASNLWKEAINVR